MSADRSRMIYWLRTDSGSTELNPASTTDHTVTRKSLTSLYLGGFTYKMGITASTSESLVSIQ